MSRPKRWVEGNVKNGIIEVKLSSWRWFSDLIRQEMLDFKCYIYRGHASERWRLESSLDRAMKKIERQRREIARESHLMNFIKACRGRRGPNSRQISFNDEWWALGQHHGLSTPLLDWTESPFVALYFAFCEISTDGAKYRAIWALAREAIEEISLKIPDKYSDFKIVDPITDENFRLVSQRGMFVKIPSMTTIESAVSESFVGDSEFITLMKILIPNTERTECLRTLNRMNINHLSLFPDIEGAAIHSNTDLHIKDY